MDASTPQTPDLQRQQERKRKRKALLAGGVVLGLGAAVTLAAWSDDVFADGTFNTGGTFELQGASDPTGTEFKDYDGPDGPVAESAQLSFTATATTMIDSQTVYSPLTIATSADTPFDGEFILDSVQATGPYENLMTYRIYTVDTHGANCNPDDAENLTNEWTNPTNQALTTILDGLKEIPIAGTVLTPLINVLTGLGTIPALSLPVNDPTGGLTAVSPLPVGERGNNPQYLCIAATMGLVPPASSGPLDVINNPIISAIENINEVAVQRIDNSASNTTVTWTFTGEPVAP